MVQAKKPEELDRMRSAGRIAAGIFNELEKCICPGITTGELDRRAAGLMKEHNARSAFLGYRGYPGSICVSVNEEVVHGIPGARRIRMGDIVSIDLGVIVDDYYSDMAKTIMVGVQDERVISLVNTARDALASGIEQAVAGNRLSDISSAVEKRAQKSGFAVVRQFVGHGIGRNMHEEPQIPNFGPPGRGPVLKNAMTLAIEPMLTLGTADVEILDDGWTAVTCDRRFSAHFEHTVAVRDGQAEVLTVV